MSKKKRTERAHRPLIINRDLHVSAENISAYLLETLNRYNGYHYISISAGGALYSEPIRAHVVLITVHGLFPRYMDRGLYQGGRDICIEAIVISDSTFKGLVMNKQGECILGNPFTSCDINNQFELGDAASDKQYTPTAKVSEPEIEPWTEILRDANDTVCAQREAEEKEESISEVDEEILEGELITD